MEYINDPRRKKAEILVAPTASGKSWIIAGVVNRFSGSVLVLQPSKELLSQNLSKYELLGGEAAVFCAGLGRKELDKRVIYGTLGSLKSVVGQLSIDLVIIDEAHHTFSPEEGSSFMNFISVLRPRKVVGLTATPFRLSNTLDGAMLKMLNRMKPSYFKDYIHVIQIQDIIAQNFWAKIRYEIQVFDTDVLKLNSSGSEFTEQSIKEAIETQSINRRIYFRVKELLDLNYPSILVFVDCIDTAEKMVQHTPHSAYLTANTTDKERTRIVEEFKSGKIKVLYNVGILTTGFDFPDLRAIIMGRPTNSLALYYQIVGRGTRPSPGTDKTECLYIDFGGNIERFGFIEHLVMEHIDGWGWCFTNGEYVLTNILMGTARVKKSDLNTKHNPNVMPFGKHKGKPLSQIPLKDIEWLVYKSPITFDSPKMQALRTKLVAILEQNKSLV